MSIDDRIVKSSTLHPSNTISSLAVIDMMDQRTKITWNIPHVFISSRAAQVSRWTTNRFCIPARETTKAPTCAENPAQFARNMARIGLCRLVLPDQIHLRRCIQTMIEIQSELICLALSHCIT